jgi:tripartite-type tricarboxylate transporter receptor subunit TctC
MLARKIVLGAGLAAALLTTAAAQQWPAGKPIRFIVGFGAGGGTDIVTRIVAVPLGEALGQSIIVENKPGAGSTIASNEVAKAPKDGYTAAVLSGGHSVSAAMMKSLPFEPVKDFAAVGLIGTSAFVFVANKDFPANNINELVALAKAQPGKLNFASVGVGSTQHFAGELLHQMTGMQVQHVPYRGTPAVVTALRTKEADYSVELVHAVIGQVESGDLKILAVAAGQRWPSIPNTPTVAETVSGYEVTTWYGIAYPAGTPQPIIEKTSTALKTVLDSPAIRERLSKAGAEARFSTPDELQRHMDVEISKWKTVREKAGIAQN